MLPEKGIKILIVDDFPTMRKINRTLLKQLGYENIVEAEDGENALAVLAKENDVGFIVSDWNMPVMSGLEFLGAVRKDPRFRHLPFLMVTAEAEQENIITAVKAGVSNYVVKPFTGATLKMKMEKIWENLAKKAS